MELTDTHCHIQSAGAKGGERITHQKWAKVRGLDGAKMVADAAADGVTRLVCVGCDGEDSRLAVDFVHNQPGCWASIGIHPHEAQHYAGSDAKLNVFEKLASEPKVVAVGECGLDYYYEHSPKSDQVQMLRFQIELALKHDLPAIFHVREAFDDFWPVFDDYSGLRGVLHSFTDSKHNLQKALERNLYIGVNGIITFVKDPARLAVYRSIPLQNLLLETDAPFLTPTPYRGSINEPRRVRRVAEFVSELRGEPLEELAQATTINAQTLFAIE